MANLSLGGPTNAAARELDDAAVEALINADIVPAVAAGNEGFSSVTTGSPSTSFAALTVGSASDHRHEQIFRAQFSAPCSTAPLASVFACAQAYRSDTNVQISEFSSRGPTILRPHRSGCRCSRIVQLQPVIWRRDDRELRQRDVL